MSDTANVSVPEAPAQELHPDGTPVLKGANSTQYWPTEEKANEVAKSRTKGARRAYKIVAPDGTISYATSTHHHFLMQYIMENELKYDITEIGKVAAAKNQVTVASVWAAIDALPTQEDKESIKAQLAAFLAAMK